MYRMWSATEDRFPHAFEIDAVDSCCFAIMVRLRRGATNCSALVTCGNVVPPKNGHWTEPTVASGPTEYACAYAMTFHYRAWDCERAY